MQRLKKVVIIGGCGHVGLPLGIVLANCGLDVVLLDRDQGKIDTVNAGQMPFMENNALEQLGRVVGRKLIATLDPGCLRDSDAAIAVLGTPVARVPEPSTLAMTAGGLLLALVVFLRRAGRPGSLLADRIPIGRPQAAPRCTRSVASAW